MEGNRGDLQPVFFFHQTETGFFKIAIEHYLRGSVLKYAAFAVLQAQKIGGEHGKAVMLSLYNTFSVAIAVI